MPVLDIDLTTAGLVPEGKHIATVTGLKYQVKTGDKWNKDGTLDVSYDEFCSFHSDVRRLHYTLTIPEAGTLFHDLYMKPAALGFAKQFMDACGVKISKEGFNPEDAIGCQVTLTIAHKDDPEFGIQANITKISKA